MEKHGEIREDITPAEQPDGTLEGQEKLGGSVGTPTPQGSRDVLAEQHPVSRFTKHMGRRLIGRVSPPSQRG